MKRKMKSFVAAFAATTIMLGAVPSVAWADDPYNNATNSSDAKQFNVNAVDWTDGTNTNSDLAVFTKSLSIEREANIPKTNFIFEIKAEEQGSGEESKYVKKAANGDDLSVLVGYNADKIKVYGYDADGTNNNDKFYTVTKKDSVISLAANSETSYYQDSTAKSTVINLAYAVQKVNRTETGSGITAVAENTTDDDYVKIVDKPSGDAATYLANKSVLLDFSACEFDEPGIYRYVIEEKYTGGSTITPDTITKRTIDVYVENAGTTSGTPTRNDLVVTGYVIYKDNGTGDIGGDLPNSHYEAAPSASGSTLMEDGSTTLQPNGEEASDATLTNVKSSGFLNSYDTANLTIGKRVEGNQASKDKFFKYTIAFENLGDGTVLQVNQEKTSIVTTSGTTDTPPNSATNAAYTGTVIDTANGLIDVVAQADGTKSIDIYLRSGDYITFTGLPTGATYTVTETPEDYNPYYYGDTDSNGTVMDYNKLNAYITTGTEPGTPTKTTYSAAIAKTALTANASTHKLDDYEYAFRNEKAGVLPTGIIMSVAPAVGLVLAGLIAAFAVVLGGKKRRDELEDE